MKKLYSIWICSHAPKEVANTITQYRFKPENIVGKAPDCREKYDLMSLVMICLGDNEDNGSRLLRMLYVLLKKFVEDGEPISKEFEQENDLNLSDIYGEVSDMCNISEGIYNKGKTEGIALGEARGEAKGRTKERENLAANLREMGLTEEQIKQALKPRN